MALLAQSACMERSGCACYESKSRSSFERVGAALVTLDQRVSHAAAETFELVNAARLSSSGSRSPAEAQTKMLFAISVRLLGVRKFGGSDCTT